MELVLEKSVIRSWRMSDATSLVRHADDRDVWRNLRDQFPHPYTPADAESWLRAVREMVPETSFAIAVGGEAAGGIGLKMGTDVYRRQMEIGYWLGQSQWGRGIVSEAVVAMSDYAFAHFPLCRLFACVFEWNPASMRVLEKAGYVLEGRHRKSVTKDGQTIDELVYALVRP
jgi:RimJ/RimL family protein N-acetyltransferase